MLSAHRIGICFSILSSLALGQLQTFSPPGQNKITYSINIPDQTASSGSGPIFIQLKSTTIDIEWFAFGEGTRMQGSNIFLVYGNGNGNNVTVSPRLGGAYVEPLYNSKAQVTLLDGSGISNGTVTANIRCDNCITWSGGKEDVTSSSTSWVWAVKYGKLIKSDSVSATISQHDVSGLASVNLQAATGGNTGNPFITTSSDSSVPSASSASSTSPASSNPSSSGSSQPVVTTFSTQSTDRKRIAHAAIMIIVMVVLFPSFALGIHLLPSSWAVVLHGWLQVFTLALTIAGFALGISLSINLYPVTGSSYHQIIGIIVVSCLTLFQPAMGLLQHRYWCKNEKKGLFAYLHRWLGRTMIALGIVNAGLGFRYTGIGSTMAPKGAVIAYGVVAGIVGLGYILTLGFLARRRRHARPT
ncbi:integral membrane protein [Talaromyces pinophilus]|uniref:Integral membrane protein n=1 Tax=Talaromyces pinophilus TaxID=128442 RepID=A0A698XLB3_TALPI|nr:integral membrane protein [Talaromyces pinophilus]